MDSKVTEDEGAVYFVFVDVPYGGALLEGPFIGGAIPAKVDEDTIAVIRGVDVSEEFGV